MDTHAFPEGIKIQRFCLTLVGEARLWYESLGLIALDWNELQTQFRQQYLKMGTTREQLFHAWRSFHFDENSETLDSYITCIRQEIGKCQTEVMLSTNKIIEKGHSSRRFYAHAQTNVFSEHVP